jgi:hypothetical protein
MDWIQGNKFQTLAKWTYRPEIKAACDYANFPSTFNRKLLEDNDIIYTQGFHEYKKPLLEDIRKSEKKVILISHNCDNPIDGTYILPDNVIKWYSTNVNTDDPRVESIPIGLQNDIWFKKNKFSPSPVNKIERIIEKLKEEKHIRNLVYMDHRIYCNPKVRIIPYQVLGNKSYVTSATEEMYGKDVMDGKIFEKYLDGVYNHKFVICPEGNGIDTHRPWEALYLGVIPIEKKCINNSFFKDLPICFVNDWEEVTESFLINWLIDYRKREWSMEMLTFEYWKNKIFNTL